jgi:hypothetical protein
MTKRNWSVSVKGYKPFPMLTLDRALSHDDALAFARSIWPTCTIA